MEETVLLRDGKAVTKTQTVVTDCSPRDFDRLMPVNCQVVIESGNGTPFVNDVDSLKHRKVQTL